MKESGDLRQIIIEVKAITTIENAGSFIADLTIDKQELRLEEDFSCLEYLPSSISKPPGWVRR